MTEQWFDILKFQGGASMMQAKKEAAQEILSNSQNLKWLQALDKLVEKTYNKRGISKIPIALMNKGIPAMGGFNAVSYRPEVETNGIKGTILINHSIFMKHGGPDYFFDTLKDYFKQEGDFVEGDNQSITITLREGDTTDDGSWEEAFNPRPTSGSHRNLSGTSIRDRVRERRTKDQDFYVEPGQDIQFVEDDDTE